MTLPHTVVLQVDPTTILGALWAAYVVMRLETLARHHRDLRNRVHGEHGVKDE